MCRYLFSIGRQLLASGPYVEPVSRLCFASLAEVDLFLDRPTCWNRPLIYLLPWVRSAAATAIAAAAAAAEIRCCPSLHTGGALYILTQRTAVALAVLPRLHLLPPQAFGRGGGLRRSLRLDCHHGDQRRRRGAYHDHISAVCFVCF